MRFIPLGRLGDVPQDSTGAGSSGTPFSAAALSAMTELRPEIISSIGTALRTPAVQSDGSGSADACRCMLDAVPELAQGDSAVYQQGLQLCLQNAAAFAAQLRTAGYDTSACGVSGGGAAWYTTTGGRVAIGVGVLAVLAGGALLVLR